MNHIEEKSDFISTYELSTLVEEYLLVVCGSLDSHMVNKGHIGDSVSIMEKRSPHINLSFVELKIWPFVVNKTKYILNSL